MTYSLKLPFTNNPDFHGTVTIASSVQFGARCTVWQYSAIGHDTIIGDDVVIGSNVYIGHNVSIGQGTHIQHGAFIPNHVTIGDKVFIGPNVTLTDDKYPRAGEAYSAQPPILEEGCSLGAGSVILPGVRVGTGAMVGAGAVVSKDVPPHTTVKGCPAI